MAFASRLGRTAAAAALAIGLAAPAAAQAPATGRLVVTVVDQTGGVLPGATVTLTGQEAATREAVVAPAATSPVGLATVEGLAPGRYTLQVEFSGFETAVIRDVRVRAGDNRRSVTLALKKVAEDVVVGRDRQSAALDPLGMAFSTVLTREQIEMLPDDPDEMEALLKAMAPPGATIRIDGFSGGRLPPKSQIRSIRLPRMDQLAAQNHGGLGGALHIDIMTQPGAGPLRGSTDFTFRDDALNARNPFAPVKGDEGLRQGGVSLSGTLVPNKVSFAINAQGARQHDTGNLLAAVPGSTRAEPIIQPTNRWNVNGRFDMAINKDHAMRMSYQRIAFTRQNLGVGAFDLPERAYSSESADNVFRVSENGPVGRRFFSESRMQVRWSESASRSAIEAPTVRVLDAFTSGGAQQSGGRRTLEFEAATDLDYVRGKHSWRTGVLVEGGRYRSDDFSNYLGTFTFASLADFEAGRPSTYTRRIGDPDVRYGNLQFGAYVQDDFRVSRSLMLSYGLRYEADTLLDDAMNLLPRVSLTWSPLRSGRTTLRGGWGAFSDWLGTGVYEQTLRVDGQRQRELNIRNPSFPDPGTEGVAPPTNRYLLGDGLVLPGSVGANVGVDQMLTQSWRVNATYTRRTGDRLLRGRNLNAPVGGVRPDPAFANVVVVTGDAASRTHSVNVGSNLMLLNWRRTLIFGNYTWTRAESNATGAFSLPANGDDLSTEWGPTSPRHRVSLSFNMQPIANFSVSMNARAQSGSPYNITSGVDANGDGVFNDRPAGVGRNAGVAASQWDIGLRLSYAIGFGPRGQAGGGTPTVVMIGGGGGGMPAGPGVGPDGRRYRLEFFVAAQNLTNHRNYVGYSGVMTSPFFGRPTNVMNPRKIEMGVRVGF